MIKRLVFGALIWILAVPGQADVYRCDIDGVVVFADAPCQPDAIPYHSRGDISVVEAPSDLDEIEAANQAMIRHRLAQQAERAAAARQRPEAPTPPMLHRETAPFVPVYERPPYHYDDRRKLPEDNIQRERPYSALSGRLPGTRRRDKDE